MSKPMTEARLKDIEEVARDYNQISGNAARELIAEVRRLHERIKNAPHTKDCKLTLVNTTSPRVCTCWKRQELGGE